MSEHIRVIIFKEGDFWIAQGLEHDICAQGKTVTEAQEFFEVTATLEEHEAGGLARIGAAPPAYFKMWDQRAGNFEPVSRKAHDSIEFGIAA